jgi:hypothetical protein
VQGLPCCPPAGSPGCGKSRRTSGWDWRRRRAASQMGHLQRDCVRMLPGLGAVCVRENTGPARSSRPRAGRRCRARRRSCACARAAGSGSPGESVLYSVRPVEASWTLRLKRLEANGQLPEPASAARSITMSDVAIALGALLPLDASLLLADGRVHRPPHVVLDMPALALLQVRTGHA